MAGAVDWLRGRPVTAGRPLFVIGFSFGAWVGLRYAGSDPSIAGYYALILQATGDRDKAKAYLPWAFKAKLLPQEKALFERANAGL